MNKNFFLLIKSSLTFRKLSGFLFSIFIVLSTVFILISMCLIFPLASNIENRINNHIYNRELYLEYTSVTDEKKIQEDIAQMKKVHHVTDIYLQSPDLQVGETTGILKGRYTLSTLHKGHNPIITNGIAFSESDSGVALVPEKIRDRDEDNRKTTTIMGKDLIGKILTLSYANKFTYKVQVVGTYDITDPVFDGDEIIVPRNDIIRGVTVINETYPEGQSSLLRNTTFLISVDHYKNIEKAQKELSEIYQVDKKENLKIDAELYNISLIILMISLAVFLIMTVSGLFVFLQSNIKNRTKELALYRSMGYKSSHLFYILFIEHMLSGLFALIIGITATVLLIHSVVNSYLDTLLGNTFMNMTASINIMQIFCLLMFFIVILLAVCRQAVKRSEKIDLTILLKEH